MEKNNTDRQCYMESDGNSTRDHCMESDDNISSAKDHCMVSDGNFARGCCMGSDRNSAMDCTVRRYCVESDGCTGRKCCLENECGTLTDTAWRVIVELVGHAASVTFGALMGKAALRVMVTLRRDTASTVILRLEDLEHQKSDSPQLDSYY